LFDRPTIINRRKSLLASERALVVRAGAKAAVSAENRPGSIKRVVKVVCVLLFSLLLSCGLRSAAQEAAPSEYQIKSAFLYNFAKFVEWPVSAFATPTSPIVVGVLGNNVFGDNLEKTLSNKVLNNRPLEYKKFESVMEATNCQILFISSSEKGKLPKIFEALRGTSVLTVSETPEFIEAGGMINFTLEANKIRFQINDETAKKARLKISSKLLSLAVHPH